MMTRMYLLASACLVLAGCSDRMRPSGPEELARFEAAGQAKGPEGNGGPWGVSGPTIDMNRVLQARIVPGPYRVVPGDVLRVEMPRFLEQPPVAGPAADSRQPYKCRIAENGTITLPIVGAVAVQGQSLAQIEATIAGRYYPMYVAAPLPVYVGVEEYQTKQVCVEGAVTTPGNHALRHDQMTLVSLLMQAGGIVPQGAAIIRINRARGMSPNVPSARSPLSAGTPSPAGDMPESPPGAQTLQAVFEREGALRTTGWLYVGEEQGRASIRGWLDIGNRPQRSEFLGALAAQAGGDATQELEAKLVRLAHYLDEPGRTQAGATRWQMLGNGCFTTAFDGSGPERGAPRRAMTTTAPIQTASAVGSARGDVPRPSTPSRKVVPSPGVGTVPGPQRPSTEPIVPPLQPQGVSEPRDLFSITQPREANSRPETTTPSLPRGSLPPPRPPVQVPQTAKPAQGVETLVLPVRGLNIPFADVPLEEGDTVVVEPPREQFVSVVGLVAKPGNMPYPPGAQYTLIQAIAFAGGLDLVADPRYVSVYRLAPDGEVVGATFRLLHPRNQRQLTQALALPLKPGDVVSVEQTPRTRTNLFFERVFRITLGLYLNPNDTWN
jgi:protein involved in polysaccharide export with SLBB domain